MQPVRPSVVVADDDPLITALVEQQLGRDGFEVRACPDGREALHAALEQRPSLMILDIEMPRLSGLEVLKRLRGGGWGKTLPVMLLTARRRPDQIAEALEAGASDYLTKPFKPEVLATRAQRLIRSAGVTWPQGAPSPADAFARSR